MPDPDRGAAASDAPPAPPLSARPVAAGDARRAQWWPLGLALICGAAIGTGHAPFALWPVALAGVAGLVGLILRAPDARSAARRSWAAGLGHFALTLHWIVEPFLVDAARHGWMAPFALGLLAGGLALFWAAAGWLARRGAGAQAQSWTGVLSVACAMTLAEMVRSSLFTGFPWALLGMIWVSTPALSLAAWTGVHGLTLVSLLAGGALWLAVAKRRPAALILPVCVAGLVGLAVRAAPVPTEGTGPVVRLVQPNAAQHLKWRADMIPVFWARKLALSAGAEGSAPPDLVIWPEVTLPFPLGDDPAALRDVGAAARAPVMLGAQRFTRDGALRNALTIIGSDGSIGPIYDKHHLVPFGEYFPGGALAERLGLSGLATGAPGGFSAGPGPQVLDLAQAGLGRVLPLICYEAIFPRHAVSQAGRPDWIAHITNDAWFGTFAGPQQHLDHARLRAVEQGLPVLRAANTGISALIDPAGRVVASIPLGEAGALDVALPSAAPETVYARWMSAPIWAAILLLGLAVARMRRAY